MKLDPHIREELKLFFKEHVGRLKEKIIIVSPSELNTGDKELLLENVVKLPSSANIEYKIEPNLLAGVLVRVGSKVIDLSLKGQLMTVQKTLYETA